MTHRFATLSVRSTIILGVATFAIACSDSTSPASATTGVLVTRLTDAPFPTDQVKSVDVFVVRVDARQSDVTDADANVALDDQSAASNGWKTVATPDESFNLLSLQNGIAATLGQANLPAGTYNGFRLVIDQSRSSATLKDGTVLSGGSTPGIKFPSAGQSGIKIVLAQPVKIVAGTETDLVVDFNVGQSFVLRGNTIEQNGLLFKPVINASVSNLALTNSNVRLANATDNPLTLLENGAALAGAASIAFGASSACSSVNAATPALTITQGSSNTPVAGFATTLAAGHPFTFVAYPGAGGVAQFATIEQAVPVAGQAQLTAFNATAQATGFDVYVTPSGAALTTPTIANVGAGSSSGSFVTLPVGVSQVRITTAGGTTVLLDLGSQTFVSGQNAMLVIAPPASGSTTLRAFLVPGC
jgi:uncharacterized protein DUF4382